MQEKKTLLEICCGSLEDAQVAAMAGADRIELNSALFLGGLTPTIGTLRSIKESCTIPVIAMVRSRGGGFCYGQAEYELMLRDAELLLQNGADGLAFGFLKQDRSIQKIWTKAFVDLAHSYGAEAVFHRAFDCTPDLQTAVEQLLEAGVDRVLTSGGMPSAWEGREKIAVLQAQYGSAIQILPGSGLRKENAEAFLGQTQTVQLHSSCRGWKEDATAIAGQVSFAYSAGAHAKEYEVVSEEEVKGLKAVLAQFDARERKGCHAVDSQCLSVEPGYRGGRLL